MAVLRPSLIACVAFALLLATATPGAAAATRRYGSIHRTTGQRHLRE